MTKQIRFTGGLRWNSTHQLHRIIESGIPDYAGIPTAEIDDAWHDLISTTDVYLTHADLQENINNGGTFADILAGDRPYIDPRSGLHQAVVGVFHDLHCLDKIRRGLYQEYYPEDRDNKFWPHIQHCIDSIRQSLMCQADLTPIPEVHTDLRPPGRARVQPIFQVHHTCRDWGEIQRWAKKRDALDDAVWRENAARLKGER